MGHFIDLAAVLAPKEKVDQYLASLKAKTGGESAATMPDRTLVFFEEATGDFSRSAMMSRVLDTSVIALHIHDDDLWMYELYDSGNLKDKFNTKPGYWKQIPDNERASWKGNPAILVSCWSNLSQDSVSGYLVHQDAPGFDCDLKAYSDDEFPFWNCWQICDFLKKLGTPYPESDDS